MLVRFSISNFRSILDKQTLDMRGVSAYSELPHHLIDRETSHYAEPLVKSMAIYGANASGKSNLIKGLSLMQDIVNNSMAMSGDKSPLLGIVPFSFSQEQRSAPTEFEIEVIIENQVFQYGFKATRQRIVEEWLFVTPLDKQRAKAAKWFHRVMDEYAPKSALFKGNVKTWQANTRPDTLFLTAAVAGNSEMLAHLHKWLVFNVWVVGDLSQKTRMYARFTSDSIRALTTEEELIDSLLPATKKMRSENKVNVLAFMKELDCGQDIVDIVVKKIADTNPNNGNSVLASNSSSELSETYFLHQTLDSEQPPFALPLEEESRGTQALYALAMLYLWMIKLNLFVVVDELDSSLHPLLMRGLIQRFHKDAQQAQMIFTTHDVSVLSQEILRRDQVLLINKENQKTQLSPLSDFAVRQNESLEKGYLAGRYGGIPRIAQQFDWDK
mgnify:CR=1 FL=1